MSYLIFLVLGFSTLWAGLNLFDDEILLVVSLLVGSSFVLIGLFASPPQLQIAIEIVLVLSVFRICMACIERGDSA